MSIPGLRGLLCRAFAGVALAGAGCAQAADAPYPGTLTLAVDLRDNMHRVFAVQETIPADPGPLTLAYPKWIPGEHGPTGTLDGIAGLVITADGQPLPWRRDLVDMFALHVEVPPGAHAVTLSFQFLSGGEGRNYGAGVSMTPNLTILEWNQVVFYPAGVASSKVNVQANATVPADWGSATALETTRSAGGQFAFAPVSLEKLVDSPLATGRWFRRIELSADPVPVRLDLVADRAEYLAASEEQVQKYKRLVAEAQALFGAHHYGHYDFLFVLSDLTNHFGLEHHQSSDDRIDADFFLDPDAFLSGASLLTHEYVHSWNGKFRRPGGLLTPDYAAPMKGDLLWVYEGLTDYWGEVLAARAGLRSAEQFRDDVADFASDMALTPGRIWRPLQDTADEAQVLYQAGRAWGNWRRGVDFYPEGLLLWLDVDTLLREKSGGQRSLDDFARLFFGRDDGSYEPQGYGFDDIVAALDKVQHYDWAHFLRSRLDAKVERAPLDGLERGGYRLVYTEEPTALFKANEKRRKTTNQAASLGLVVEVGDSAGQIVDVRWNGAGFDAGLAPGMRIVAVNGTKFGADILRSAIKAAKGSSEPIELLIQDSDQFRTVKVKYHDGLRYPRLERIAGVEDRLDAIGRAHAGR